MAEPTSGPAPETTTAAAGAAAASASRARAGRALLRASSVMAAGTAVSRVLGFLRGAVLATAIGAVGVSADAFATANTVPNNLYLLIAGGVLNAVLVPQVVRAMARPDGGAEYLDRLVTAAVVVMAVVTGALVLAAPVVIAVAASGFDPAEAALATAFAAWCLPQVFFYALYTLLGQVLNARGRFGAYMWAPVVNNVVAVAGVALFVVVSGRRTLDDGPGAWSAGDVALLAGTSTLGVVAQALVLLVPLRRAGVRLRPRFGLRGMGLGSAGRTAGWTFAALAVGQVAALAVSNVASGATGGDRGAAGFAAWGYAYLVFMLPHSLVTVSVVTALFTRMSRAAAQGDRAAVRADVSSGLRTVAVATVVASAGLLVLAVPAGVLVTGSGEQGRTVGRVIVAMALGLVPFSASYLLQRASYAFEDARTPFLVQCLAAGVWAAGTLTAGLVLPADLRVAGAAASLALGQLCGAVLAAVLLRRRLGGVDGARVLRTHVRVLLCAVVAGAVGLAVVTPLADLTASGRPGALLVAAAGGTALLLAYAAGLRLLRVEEVAPLLRRLPRRR